MKYSHLLRSIQNVLNVMEVSCVSAILRVALSLMYWQVFEAYPSRVLALYAEYEAGDIGQNREVSYSASFSCELWR
jgi:hypothetical protein